MSSMAGAQAATGDVPTYTRDITPILFKNCTSCHRPGEIAPMSLLTYRETRPSARDDLQRRSPKGMPPWRADPAHGRVTERSAVDRVKRTRFFVAGLQAGAPEGPGGAACHRRRSISVAGKIGPARRHLRSCRGYHGHRQAGDHRLQVFRSPDQLYRGSVGSGVPGAPRNLRASSTTSSFTRGRRSGVTQEPRRPALGRCRPSDGQAPPPPCSERVRSLAPNMDEPERVKAAARATETTETTEPAPGSD